MLADKFEGKRLNAPNDIVVKSDDSIWFTDPLFGINGEWEGKKEKPEQASTNVYRIAKDGKLTAVITDLVNPNGLAFSPDEKKLYVVEWKGTPNRSIWSFDVNADGTVGGKKKLIDAADQGALDGFRVDRDGNLWCGWGSNGALQSEPTDVGGRKIFQLKGKSEDLDGVMVAYRLSPDTGGNWLALLRGRFDLGRMTKGLEEPSARMYARPGIRFRSMSAAGRLSRKLSSGTRLCPPARTLASPS